MTGYVRHHINIWILINIYIINTSTEYLCCRVANYSNYFPPGRAVLYLAWYRTYRSRLYSWIQHMSQKIQPTNVQKKTRFCGCFRNLVEVKQVEMEKSISAFHNSIAAPNFKWWFFGDVPFTRGPLLINKTLVYLNLKLRYWSFLRGSFPFSAREINFCAVMNKKSLRNAA